MINFAINVPPVPDRVITTVGNREITLIPVLAPGESLGGGHYRFYVTQSEAATQPQADYIGEGLTFTHTGLSAATTYYYYVQSVNAYGASPFLRVEVVTTNNFDEEFAYLENEIYKDGGIVDQFLGEVDDATTAANEALDAAREALASGDLTALEQQIQFASMQAQNALGNAMLDVEHSVRISEEFALAQQITTLEVTFNGQTASITQDLATLASDQSALAIALTELESDYAGNKASVSNQLTALSDEQNALASSLDTYRAEVDGEFAEVRQEVSAVYDPDTGAVAQAVTTVNVNGVRGILGIQVLGGEAQIIGIADTFAILNPLNGELVTAFVVADGRVIMPEAFIDALTITKLRASDGTLAFENGKLRADLIQANQIEVVLALSPPRMLIKHQLIRRTTLRE